MTRGRSENVALVITDAHDPADARDILEGILAVERVDAPATVQRRQLATTVTTPERAMAPPGPYDPAPFRSPLPCHLGRVRRHRSRRSGWPQLVRLALRFRCGSPRRANDR